jgi:hypothetical protein
MIQGNSTTTLGSIRLAPEVGYIITGIFSGVFKRRLISMDISNFKVVTVHKLPEVGEDNTVYLLGPTSGESIVVPHGFLWNNGKYEPYNIETGV